MVSHDSGSSDERLQQMKTAFDETKAGVKGMVDAGVTKVPPIFVHYSGEDTSTQVTQLDQNNFTIPVVDLSKSADVRRAKVVDGIRRAAESVGFFQVVNHGIPKKVLDDILVAVRGFHELPSEVKAEYCTRDLARKVNFLTSCGLYEFKAANWNDSLLCYMAPEPLDPLEIPQICRDITVEYSQRVHKLAVTLLELLSEALGLKSNYLLELDCAKEHFLLGHYYPPSPQPELTMGVQKHSDANFLTILLQDNIGGLQVLHEKQWFDVAPIDGALVVNIGDLLQLISNNKFISAEHRAVNKIEDPRISVAYFFAPHSLESSERFYEPIKEFTSDTNPPIYRAANYKEYLGEYYKKGMNAGVSGLEYLKF